MIRRISGLLATLLALPVATAFAAQPPTVAVSNARMQVIIARRPAAGYFDLKNNSSATVTLSGASAPDCQSVMLHRSMTKGGMSRMIMVKSIAVAPHGTLSFAPGGYHLMCMQPSGALLTHKGTEPVTLMFADGSKVVMPFAIRGVGR